MLIDALGALLVSRNVGALATTLFLTKMPDQPDTCLALFQYEGAAPVRVMSSGDGVVVEYPRVQVLSRAPSPTTAHDQAVRAMNVLDGFSGETGGQRVYYSMALQRPPFPIERDANDRWVYGVNFELAIARSS